MEVDINISASSYKIKRIQTTGKKNKTINISKMLFDHIRMNYFILMLHYRFTFYKFMNFPFIFPDVHLFSVIS